MGKSRLGPPSDPGPDIVTPSHSPPSQVEHEDSIISGSRGEGGREDEGKQDNSGSQSAKEEVHLPPSPQVRRSGRRSAPVQRFDSLSSFSTTEMTSTNASRRNPKRKASESTRRPGFPPSELLNEALRPLEATDLEEWEGWVELESEPAFFNIILRDLGVEKIKAQELFTLDQVSIDLLSKPVFGLIFLFEYHPALDGEGEQEDAGNLWFANQVTQNACATVALLNIIMNVPDLELGPQLSHFKESTTNMPTALRGYKLSSDTFIRRTHNSFTRRMNHLNTDLALENDASRPKPKKTKPSSGSAGGAARGRAGKGGKGRKKAEPSTYGYHFIAYVPAGGDIWELDGLKSSPHRLGPVDSEDWTSVVRPQIEARMLQYEETQLSFNLLALCQSPLIGHREDIARAVSALRRLHQKMSGCTAFTEAIAREGSLLGPEADRTADLPDFDLTVLNIEQARISEHLSEILARSNLGADEAVPLHGELMTEVKVAIGQYRDELVAMADDERRVQGRKSDFGPALHKWVTKLAEKGVLESIINDI